MKRETEFKILQQGAVKMAHNYGYMLVGDEDAVCFFIDIVGWADVVCSYENNGCPVIELYKDDLDSDDYDELTSIEFSEYPDWRFHAAWGRGKTIAIALVRRAADRVD